jgi:hypothetical protein
MTERTEIISLGFTVADAQAPSLHLAEQRLLVSFVDWKDTRVEADFADVIALRWQEAEYLIDDLERYDSVHLVHDSLWLAEHERQQMTWANSNHRHLKLNFNAAGILEVLCTDVTVKTVGPNEA